MGLKQNFKSERKDCQAGGWGVCGWIIPIIMPLLGLPLGLPFGPSVAKMILPQSICKICHVVFIKRTMLLTHLVITGHRKDQSVLLL